MDNHLDDSFSPDWLSAPGETIVDRLEDMGWTQEEFAQKIGYTSQYVEQLIKGEAVLNNDAAIRLEQVLGGPTDFWCTREANYRARCVHLK